MKNSKNTREKNDKFIFMVVMVMVMNIFYGFRESFEIFGVM